MVGGAASTGTISASGIYTAPASVPTPNTVTVTAVSSADSTKSASATVTILPPPVSVTVSPTSASVIILHTQQFTATVSNASNTSVVWAVNGTTGGSISVGTISASGLYTAPSVVPSAPVVTVTATSSADATKSASAQLTIQAPPVPTGTWSSIGPGGITDSASLVADPNNSQTMYAAPIHGGLFKTTNLGQTWSLLPTSSTALSYSPIIAPTGGTLYALSRSSYQISTNGGQSFSTATNYPGNLDSDSATGFTVAVDPKSDQTVYILTPTALLRSANGGATWSPLTAPVSPLVVSGVPYPGLQTLAVSAGNSSVLYCASTAGFEISKDGGVTWQFQNTGLDPSFLLLRQIVQDPANPNRLLALGTYSGTGVSSNTSYVDLSTDGGTTWSHIGTFASYDRVATSQTGSGVYVISSSSSVIPHGLYVTFNSGATWTNIAPASDVSGYTAAVSTASPLIMAYEGSNDLFISKDGGSTWTVSETGLNSRIVGQLVYAGTSGPLFAIGLSSSPQLWQTSDPSQPWTRIVGAYSGVPLILFDVDPQNPLHLLGLESATSAVSTDGGATWTSIPYATGMSTGFQSFQYSVVHFGAPGSNAAYACGSFGIARLSTVSNTWSIINGSIPSGATCTAIGVDELTLGTLYIDTTSGVYKTTDGGNTWTFMFADTGTIASIIVDPTNSLKVYASAGLGASMRSTDGGKTWIPMLAEGVMAINPTSPNILYAITANTLAASYDSGLTWASTPSPYNFQQDLTVTPSGSVVISTFYSSVVEFIPH